MGSGWLESWPRLGVEVSSVWLERWAQIRWGGGPRLDGEVGSG